jgi:hypothetical protein
MLRSTYIRLIAGSGRWFWHGNRGKPGEMPSDTEDRLRAERGEGPLCLTDADDSHVDSQKPYRKRHNRAQKTMQQGGGYWGVN